MAEIAITPVMRLKNFAPPLRDTSEIFCPLGPKNEKFPKYPQNMKKLHFRNIEKKLIKSKIFAPLLGKSKFAPPPSRNV